MERVIKKHIITVPDPLMDPLQLAHRAGKNTHHGHSTQSPGTSQNHSQPVCRLLLCIQLYSHTSQQRHSPPASTWTTNWSCGLQTSSPTDHRGCWSITPSDISVTSTGSPQGCILSPTLFILYTDDCRSTHPNCHLLLSLLSGLSHHHSSVLAWLCGVVW